LKQVLEWCFPKAILGARSFSDIAGAAPEDFLETVFRLPLRNTMVGEQALFTDRFSTPEARERVLREMSDEAVRSILFLKNVRRISFGVLRGREPDSIAVIDASDTPREFGAFLGDIDIQMQRLEVGPKLECDFGRSIRRAQPDYEDEVRNFWIFHRARFDDPDLVEKREYMRRNEERAVPWVALAVPLDAAACALDGGETANWRVYLPILEPGPSACVMHGAFFVGPSRQKADFRLNESDEGKRRTEWNTHLVKHALVPLLKDISITLPDLAPDLLERDPTKFVSLFPKMEKPSGSVANLSDVFRTSFVSGAWTLSLRDSFGERFDFWIGDSSERTTLEAVTESMSGYTDRFRSLSRPQRRFIPRVLLDAVGSRVSGAEGVVLKRSLSADVAQQILLHEDPPKEKHLEDLLEPLLGSGSGAAALQNVWAFKSAHGGSLLRFDSEKLYVLEDPGAEPIITHIRSLGLPFNSTHWVVPAVGLPKVLVENRRAFENILSAHATAAFELLRRLPAENRHDLLTQEHQIKPVVDFLVEHRTRLTPDLRLGFLVATAHGKHSRRSLGVILLKPATPSTAEEALWELWLRKLFAEVDGRFARELHRLLDAAPGSIDSLHAADCRVQIASFATAFRLLHELRLSHAAEYATLQKEIAEATSDQAKGGNRRRSAERVANALLEYAHEHWDELDEEQQMTVLALPIHRRPDGSFVSLVSVDGGDLDELRRRYRLQARDDLLDAPVALPACELLQTVNSTVKDFYRVHVEFETHDRTAVLKDVLEQIGDEGADSERMLRYLAQYYRNKVDELERSGSDADLKDAAELKELITTARIVRCTDGSWQTAEDASEAWRLASQLADQGWPRNRLEWLVGELLADEYVAKLDDATQDLLHSLCTLRSHDPRTIAAVALSSESSELKFPERVKLLTENLRDGLAPSVERAAVLNAVTLPSLSGMSSLTEVEVLGNAGGYPDEVLRVLAPNAIDLQRLAAETGSNLSDLLRVLAAFGIEDVSACQLDDRLGTRFTEVWSQLGKREKLALLELIGNRKLTSPLREEAEATEVVLSSAGADAWRRPSEMVSPDWAASKPPFLPSDQIPVTVSPAVKQVWNEWCSFRTFGDVLTQVVQAAAARAGDPERTASELYQWIENAIGSAPSETDLDQLCGQAWVLGRRGEECQFQRPDQVLVHPGEGVLGACFSVPAVPLPAVAQRSQERLGFPQSVPADAESLRLIATCLEERGTLDAVAAVHVYGLIEQLVEDDRRLAQAWQQLATDRPVYRAFREPERLLSSTDLFIGSGEYQEDLSHTLVCLKAGGTLPKGLIALYRALGVPDSPTLKQVIEAASTLETDHPGAETAYSQLLQTLVKLAGDAPSGLDSDALSTVRVLACNGRYVPLSDCYWDEELGWRSRVAPESAGLLIDTKDPSTQRFARWLSRVHPAALVSLREAADLGLEELPSELALTPEASFLLQSWRQWIHEIGRDGSSLHDRILDMKLSLPSTPLRLVAVDGIRMRYLTDDGESITQARNWKGPIALALLSGEVFVQPLPFCVPSEGDEAPIERFDEAVAREIAILLGGAEIGRELEAKAQEILETLERPGTVLRRIYESNRESFLHQYHDQVADPEFTVLFDEYRRTSPRSKRAQELKDRMDEFLAAGPFVQARRDQIRGYGYDEFSVFAELIQNAEDAYAQREQLGMEMPSPCCVTYRLDHEDNRRVLLFEHAGRPFNYWQHGDQQDPALAHDVEGVLRSAGSFKAHSSVDGAGSSSSKTIGRFGLGFKSVYLLTDQPEVFSGPWHFAIESGYLPRQLPPPVDLAENGTRIRIPLRAEVATLPGAGELAGLLPFLRYISDLEYDGLDGSATRIEVSAKQIVQDGHAVAERVTLTCPVLGRDGAIHFLRCRSADHVGQVALLLSAEGMPTRWDDAFERDLFAALPLRAQLGCGVAASHRFEVQSGRTHLVDPRKNQERIAEVAALLQSLVASLPAYAQATGSAADWLQRFWSIWRWERGDEEWRALRQALAGALVSAAERLPIVPTLDPSTPAILSQTPCYYFYEVPDTVRDALVDAHVVIPSVDGSGVALRKDNVVADGFATAYRRTCEFAGMSRPAALVGIGWNEVAAALRERPWLAEQPKLLNKLAASLNEEQARRVASWLTLCEIRGDTEVNGSSVFRPSELLRPGFSGAENLPRRFLRCAAPGYSVEALDLLMDAGLRSSPTEEELREVLQAGDLLPAEAVGILRHLSSEGRFGSFNGLRPIFRSEWFPTGNERLSTGAAVVHGLIPEDALGDEVFQTWIGLRTMTSDPQPLPPQPPPPDVRAVLSGLSEWWTANGAEWIQEYERRLYPHARMPAVRHSFADRDHEERREWMSLLLLGSLHTMGRTQPEQHRDFLRLCETKGWLDVFADRQHDARRWMEVLEQYLDVRYDSQHYYQWMKQFVGVFQLSRWLPEYVESFLSVNRYEQPFSLNSLLAPRTNPRFSGGGPDAPPMIRTLGIGSSFVLRELTRSGVISGPYVHPHCYVPVRRVCAVLEDLGCSPLASLTNGDRSKAIHAFLAEHIGQEQAIFGGAFDLPLLALADDPLLQLEILGLEIEEDDDAAIPLGAGFELFGGHPATTQDSE
jgi:hypothetical protein